ncbi:MDR family MFS transporter [Segeticoccus rhizosphaerae]|uniref:MDR family MFS transporter n=1 Tax=Segeticoccus rhizosphaerae TaxID=1104777 RepID=UPI0010C05F76|nr:MULTISPECIES: MDR family MFS transporter [Intrasporangiaceae]
MTTTAPPATAPPQDGVFTHRQILTIFVGLMMGMFLAALDQTIVGTAIRVIADDLHGLDNQAWVTTAYLITSTIATPLWGKLSDIYGRKGFFISAISIFVVGSALCSFATSMYMLAGFRALQGIGAGGLMSLALAIIGDIVSPRERAKYQGYFLAVFGTSSVLGPIVGGFFAGSSSILGITGWRWVFLVNVPIGIAALLVVGKTLHLHHVRHDHRIDWWGAASLIVALVPLLVVAEQGRTWGWGSGTALACYVVGVIGVGLFVAAEHRMQEEALIPLRIFNNRAITITIVGSVIVGLGMFGGIMSIPLYLQIVHQATPMSSGFMMLPLVLGIMISSIVSGQLISRTGKVRIFPVLGAAIMVIGLLLLWRVRADTSLVVVMAFMLVFGLGLGNTMQPLTLIVQNAVAPREIGMATSSATFFRQMGGTLGVAIFLSILFSSAGSKIQGALQQAVPTPAFQQALHDPKLMQDPQTANFVKALTHAGQGGGGGGAGGTGILNDSSVLGKLPDALAYPFRVGFSDAMDLVFLIGALVVVLGFIVLLFLPRIELRTQSGMQAAAAERAAAAEAAAQADHDVHGSEGAGAGPNAPMAPPSPGMQGPDAHGDADSSPSEDGHGPGRHAIAELTAPAGAAASGDAKNGDGADGDGRAASELVLAALRRVEARAAGRDLSGQPTGRHRA